VLPLFPFTLSSLYLQVLAVSFVFPQRVAEWLAGPVPVAAPPLAAAIIRTLSIAVIGPIAEEVVFRGVLLPLWTRRWGFRAGILGTSALFGVLHANVVGSLVFGIVMAVLYLRTGSLLVPVAVHMLFNAPPALARWADTDPTTYTLAELRAEWMWPAAAIAVTLPGLIAFLRLVVRGGHPRGPAFSGGG
jgi:membrane protease YdiL (CAAX protease family)